MNEGCVQISSMQDINMSTWLKCSNSGDKKIKLSILTCNFKLYKATKCWVSVLRKRAHPKNTDAFAWFINILAHLLNLFHIFPSNNFKLQKIVILPKIRTFPTNVFCQYVKLNHCWIRLQELEILVHEFSCT